MAERDGDALVALDSEGVFVVNKKKERRGGLRSTSWKPGIPSPNPLGRPKKGNTWGDLFATLGNKTGPEIAKMLDKMRIKEEFAGLPDSLTIKELMAITTIAQLLRESTPGLLTAYMDREEGKVPDVVDANVKTQRTIVLDANARPIVGGDDGDEDGEDGDGESG